MTLDCWFFIILLYDMHNYTGNSNPLSLTGLRRSRTNLRLHQCCISFLMYTWACLQRALLCLCIGTFWKNAAYTQYRLLHTQMSISYDFFLCLVSNTVTLNKSMLSLYKHLQTGHSSADVRPTGNIVIQITDSFLIIVVYIKFSCQCSKCNLTHAWH